MKFWHFSIIFLIIFLALGFYFFGINKPIYKKARVIIGENVFNVDLADDPLKRSNGLSKRPSIKDNEGMLFLFDKADRYGFWMKDMNFPIDIIWIRDSKIVDISENIPPEPQKSIFNLTVYYPQEEVDKVLEIGAGLSTRYNIKIGDEIKIEF